MSVNKIPNPDFSRGDKSPQGWTWEAKRSGAKWRRGQSTQSDGHVGVTITTDRPTGCALWSRTVPCKPETFYRIEATVTCELTVDEAQAEGGEAGLVLAVQPRKGDRPAGPRRVTPSVHRASQPIALRTYYEVPQDIRRLTVSVGVVEARGQATIHHVRFIEILEPDEMSHPLAIPPPPYAQRCPKQVATVSVCSATAADRPIGDLLAGHFGKSAVRCIQPAELTPDGPEGDALLLPDAAPPPSIRSLRALLKLAEQRIVVISLPAFAKIAGSGLSVRRVEQEDDPIHAQVDFGSYATRGFALHDVFPYAWPGDEMGSFRQNQFRRGVKLTAFCKKHGFKTLLLSVCDQDVTCERPICLFKETDGGVLYVLDIDPVEAVGSTFGEPAVAMYLLLGVLGQAQNSLGQYVSPVRKESEFRDFMRELDTRFGEFIVRDSGLPIDEVTEQLVTIGRDDESFGLPLTPKPVILVRSGLSGGDVESAYGALFWFKQLLRGGPHACRYAQQLASQFRLAWLPLVAPWEARDGWRGSRKPAGDDMTITMDGATVAAIIDVTTGSTQSVGLVLPSHEGVYERYMRWVPRLLASFPAGRYYRPTVDAGEEFCDRDGYAWRHAEPEVQVIIDPEVFGGELHRSVQAAGGEVVRIEIPGNDADFAAHSIERTDLAATLLEHLIGLQYGLIAVNRQPTTVHFDGFSPVSPGDALVIDRRDPMLRVEASQAG